MKTKPWKTDAVVAAFEAIPTDIIGVVKVERAGPGGDVDTDNLVLKCKNSRVRLFVCGFVTNFDSIKDPSDCKVEMVEVTDGEDSAGGLNRDDDASAVFYARVCRTLRGMGFEVVPSMKPYF